MDVEDYEDILGWAIYTVLNVTGLDGGGFDLPTTHKVVGDGIVYVMIWGMRWDSRISRQ